MLQFSAPKRRLLLQDWVGQDGQCDLNLGQDSLEGRQLDRGVAAGLVEGSFHVLTPQDLSCQDHYLSLQRQNYMNVYSLLLFYTQTLRDLITLGACNSKSILVN